MNTTHPARIDETVFAEQIKRILESVPWLRDIQTLVNPAPFNRAFDLMADFEMPPRGPRVELWVDVHTDPRPSQFPYVNLERDFEKGGTTKRVRSWVFAAPYLSPRMREVCETHGWNWFDLAGNCRISIPSVLHLERVGNDPVHRRPVAGANLGTAEAGRVIRALLAPQNAGMRWTQRSMQNHCQPSVSLGLVNKVIRHLRDEAFVEDSDDGFRVRDALKLLFAWRDVYRFNRHERRGYFTLLQGKKLREALATLDAESGGRAAYASFSAADLQAPNVRQSKTWLFVGADELGRFEKSIEAKSVDSGENVTVLIPEDEGVFYLGDGGGPGESRLRCTNLIQTYVDLWHSGGRGQEAADALLEQRLKKEWSARGMPT